MTIPDYQSLMLPVLSYAGDGKEHRFRALVDQLAADFKLTDAEIREMLPSGVQTVFVNRVGWAKTYLKKAGLLDARRRGYFTITDQGRAVLKSKPAEINVAFLKQFPEFVEFQQRRRKTDDDGDDTSDTVTTTDKNPEELLEDAYQSIRHEVADELLSKILDCSPAFFEKLVVELLVAMGYGGSLRDAGQAIGKSGDEGIDGVIKEDKLGLDIIYVQAKRWRKGNDVGRPEIQKFAGALQGKHTKKGVFITTSRFTSEATEFARMIDTKVILIDGSRLTHPMIDHGVGVSTVNMYKIVRLDADYFEEE